MMFERFAKFIPIAAAAVAVLVALSVLSRVVVTLDAIDQSNLLLAYIGVVVALLGGFGVFAWAKLRASRTSRPMPRERIDHKRRLSPEARLEAVYARHHLDDVAPAAPARAAPSPMPRRDPGEMAIAIAGVRGAGKSALAEALSALDASDTAADALAVELVELADLTTDLGRNLERLAPARASDLTLFVVDQDLRDYEQAAIEALVRRNIALLVVMNKSDLLRADALDETRAAIAEKLARIGCNADIIVSSAAPRPQTRLAEDAHGVREVEVARAPQVSAVFDHLTGIARERGRSGIHIRTVAA